jgi:poly-gamma-glutamate synthase PgsB/CapB
MEIRSLLIFIQMVLTNSIHGKMPDGNSMISLFSHVDYVLVITGGAAFAFLFIETARLFIHQRRVRRIPLRIHVNGSRGKSSVTRLIGAVLRATGKVTVTKTTGTAARFILPDGYEIPIFRPGKANITEQFKVVKKAHELGAEALVVECMAVTPEYIDIVQTKIIQGTIGIMTNVRDDHLDVMGPTVYDAAVNMSKSLPRKGHVVTAETKFYGVVEKEALKRRSAITRACGTDVTDEEAAGFDYIEHKDNIAIALAVAAMFGLPRKKALAAMYGANPDPGMLREIIVGGRPGTVYFFNALAANDPDSSQVIWDLAKQKRKGKGIIIMVLRPDRVQRTQSYFKCLGTTMTADQYIIAGAQSNALVNHLKKRGVADKNIIAIRKAGHEALIETLLNLADTDTVACAMGNIVGLGDEFVKGLHSLARGATQRAGNDCADGLQLLSLAPKERTCLALN